MEDLGVREAYWNHTSRLRKNRTGYVQVAYMEIERDMHMGLHEERFSDFSKDVLHYRDLIWEHLDPGMSTFYLNLYPNMIFEAILLYHVRSRDP